MTLRIIELYKDGGILEVWRGIRDWYQFNIRRQIIAFVKNKSEIEIGEISIVWTIENEESVSRASEHSEIPVMEDFVDSVKSSEVFWDIGANQGVYSMLGGKCGLDVHAFEPGEKTHKILKKNANLNDENVAIHPIALDDETGEKILTKTGRTGNRTIASSGEGDHVTVKRGDEVSAPSPDIIKIDVEGLELSVLDGLGDRLSACRLCYVEVHDEHEIREIEGKLVESGLNDIDYLPAGQQLMLRTQRDE